MVMRERRARRRSLLGRRRSRGTRMRSMGCRGAFFFMDEGALALYIDAKVKLKLGDAHQCTITALI